MIFDMGDIFFDATPWRRALTACLQQEKRGDRLRLVCRQWEAKLVEVYLGRRDYWDAFREFIADFGLSQDAADRVLNFAKAKVRRSRERTLFDGVAETLAALESSGLETGGALGHREPGAAVRQRLAALGIEQNFDAVLTSIDVGYVKPAAGGLRIGFAAHGRLCRGNDLRGPRSG